MSMRIVGGAARGRLLRTAAGNALRPTGARTREALFDILGDRISGARFLDLFAGSGAIGIEALSRGAAAVTFVDNHTTAWRYISDNLARAELGGGRLLKMDFRAAIEALSRKREQYDYVFIDPPYDSDLAALTLRHMRFYPILAPDGAVIVETSRLRQFTHTPRPFHITAQRRYGDTLLIFLQQMAIMPPVASEPQPGGDLS